MDSQDIIYINIYIHLNSVNLLRFWIFLCMQKFCHIVRVKLRRDPTIQNRNLPMSSHMSSMSRNGERVKKRRKLLRLFVFSIWIWVPLHSVRYIDSARPGWGLNSQCSGCACSKPIEIIELFLLEFHQQCCRSLNSPICYSWRPGCSHNTRTPGYVSRMFPISDPAFWNSWPVELRNLNLN